MSVRDKAKKQLVIYLTPQGQLLEANWVQKLAKTDSEFDEIILICGRYAGVDQRFIDMYVDREISIGNYVLSGGELPALVLIEAVSRFIPGVLGKIESAEQDSLQNQLLEAPQYTRPQEWNGLQVPEVLLSGNHRLIDKWKREEALKVTQQKRPELLHTMRSKNET